MLKPDCEVVHSHILKVRVVGIPTAFVILVTPALLKAAPCVQNKVRAVCGA